MIIFDKFLPFKGGIKLISEFEVRKTARVHSISVRKDMAKVVEWSSSKFNTIAVPAYNFKELRDYGGFFEYSYDMPRMGRINKEHKEIIQFIVDRQHDEWGRPLKNPFNPNCLNEKETLFMNNAWENHRDLMTFLLDVHEDNKYGDLHEGNVMILPDTGDFALIDLEGFIVRGYDIGWMDNHLIPSN